MPLLALKNESLNEYNDSTTFKELINSKDQIHNNFSKQRIGDISVSVSSSNFAEFCFRDLLLIPFLNDLSVVCS